MRRYLLISAFILTGCGNAGVTPKSEKYQAEMTIQKTRADIEELKHDLHSQTMELSILTGKILNQEDLVTSLKKDTLDLHQNKLDNYYQQIISLEKKIAGIEKKQEDVHNQLLQLAQTSNEMHKALAQNKEKLNEMERNLAGQSKSLGEMARIKKNLDKVTQLVEDVHKQVTVESYRVKIGDTLDAIAKFHNTTPDALLKINRLDTDRLIAGQELLVPSATTQ